MTLQQVKDEALHFSQRERAELAHLLLVSLDNPSSGGLEAEWDREVARRAAEVEAGSAVGRPAFAALDEIRASRTLQLERFPHSVRYRVFPDAVWILAVAPQRRRPFYWLKRTRDARDR